MDLEYTVTNQVIEKNNRKKAANLSQKYLRLCFEFTEDWDNLTKFALFKVGEDNYRQALDNDKVIVPSLVLKNKKFLFTLYGVDNNDLRITTNLVRVNLLESGFVHEAIDDDMLDDPNVVEQIYLAIDTKSDKGHTHTKSDITDFPTDVSSFTNDAGYLTEHQSLSSYYTKAEVDTLIQNANNRITLEADKTIIQNEETCTFTVYVLKDGFQRAGETVNIYAEE